MQENEPKRYRSNVAVIVTDGQGNVLLCTRSFEILKGTIQTVQGGIDAGETPRMAAMREIREELGLKDDQFTLIAEAPGLYRYDWPEDYLRQSKIKTPFSGQEQTFFLAQVAPDVLFRLDTHEREFSEVHWGKPHELVDQCWPPKKPGNEAALRHFGLL